MFLHLHVHSPYSFLDAGSDIDALVGRAARFGMPALALTDRNSLAGAIKFVQSCDARGIRPILGAELTLEDESHLTLIAQNRAGYSNLCSLITLAFTHGGRLSPRLPWDLLPGYAAGLFCLSGCRRGRVPSLLLGHRYTEAREAAILLKGWFGARFYVELQDDRTPHSHRLCRDLADMADALGVPVAATNNVHHAAPEDYITWDVLRAIATGTTLAQPHPDRPMNAQRYLKSAAEMAELFHWRPDAMANTLRIAQECECAIPSKEDVAARFAVPAHHAGSDAYLRHLAYKGARARYGTVSGDLEKRLKHELDVLCTLGFADFVLTCWDIVLWARRQGIRATGRGSAADSCVAYVLTLSHVDAYERGLPFSRFVTEGKTPDIDVDFPHNYRDDVFRHVLEQYGEDRVAMCCTFTTFWSRSAVRDISKALMLPAQATEIMTERLSGFVRADQIGNAFESYAELRPFESCRERFLLLFTLCKRIAGMPRHMGTHSSGLVISQLPLATVAPLQPSARGLMRIWTLDKDDAEEAGAIKFDVLSLRTLGAIDDAEADIRSRSPEWHYDRIPDQDRDTFGTIQAGRAVGAFQLESAAQLSLAVTLHPTTFEHLVASCALIRPGPVRGNVVKRYVSARNGWSRTDVLHPALGPILERTYGCVVFQEQASAVFAVMCGISERKGNDMRKALAHHDRKGTMDEARTEFTRAACTHHADLTPDCANLIFDQLQGWGGLGFVEGHAAAFAQMGYRTTYMSVHHPAEFFAALLNHLPLGYYNANSYVAEARRRGVTILPIDINESPWISHAEGANAIRLGMNLVDGLHEEEADAILQARQDGAFESLMDCAMRVPLRRDALEVLVLGGTFDSLHPHRRGVLWRLEETIAQSASCRAAWSAQMQLALQAGCPPPPTPCAWEIEEFSFWEKLMWEWRVTGVASSCHPFVHIREQLKHRQILTTQEALSQRHDMPVTVAGLSIRPHRPPTRSGRPVLFVTLEDEHDILQAVCSGPALIGCIPVILAAPMVIVEGVIQRQGAGVILTMERADPLIM